jgi:hypothetical protein
VQANFPEVVVQVVLDVAAVVVPAAVLEEFVGFGVVNGAVKRER